MSPVLNSTADQEGEWGKNETGLNSFLYTVLIWTVILKYNVLHVLEITIYEHLIMRLNSTMKFTKKWNSTDVDETTVFD